jgi:hypothetical protein
MEKILPSGLGKAMVSPRHSMRSVAEEAECQNRIEASARANGAAWRVERATADPAPRKRLGACSVSVANTKAKAPTSRRGQDVAELLVAGSRKRPKIDD